MLSMANHCFRRAGILSQRTSHIVLSQGRFRISTVATSQVLHCFYGPNIPLPPGHPFPWQRYQEAIQLLQKSPLLVGKIAMHEAPLASVEELSLAHDLTYITDVMQQTLSKQQLRKIGFAQANHSDFVASSLGVAGAAIAATQMVMQSKLRIVGCISGGTHHAHQNFGAGFCVFNDCAISAALAVQQLGVKNVLIVDLDVHQGNGTAAIFTNNQNVFTFSMHQRKGYPLADRAQSDLDIELEDATGDKEYLDILAMTLPSLIQDLRPGLIVYQSGVDPLEGDVMGRLALSRAGLQERNKMVFTLALEWDIPCVITFGGGYQRNRQVAVEAHADVYQQAAMMLQV